MEWKNVYRGLLIGASDVIPGVSGGTIAVLLGIYDRLINAINGIFSRRWKGQLNFLIPLVIGVGLAIFTIARIMKWLFLYYPEPTYFFFLGLIIGIIPQLLEEANVRQTFAMKQIILLLLGALAVSSMIFFMDIEPGSVITDRTFKTYLLLFISGILASAAMILPGISGSVVFLILGVYPTVIEVIYSFDIKAIIVIGTGIVIGIITMSKLIHYFLKHFRNNTFALIIGAVIGSIFVIFPGWPEQTSLIMSCLVTGASGLLGAYILGKVEYENE
ncbi:MAG TPA: DUF368 domain-containing protein [Bacillota bacterium]|nr:DUF368 domain-containing protein [Bacillota bacterium]